MTRDEFDYVLHMISNEKREQQNFTLILLSKGNPFSISHVTSGRGFPPTTHLIVLLVPTYAVTFFGSVRQTGFPSSSKIVIKKKLECTLKINICTGLTKGDLIARRGFNYLGTGMFLYNITLKLVFAHKYLNMFSEFTKITKNQI